MARQRNSTHTCVVCGRSAAEYKFFRTHTRQPNGKHLYTATDTCLECHKHMPHGVGGGRRVSYYELVHDPEGTYKPGAKFPTDEVEAGLKYHAFDGAILRKPSGKTYQVYQSKLIERVQP